MVSTDIPQMISGTAWTIAGGGVPGRLPHFGRRAALVSLLMRGGPDRPPYVGRHGRRARGFMLLWIRGPRFEVGLRHVRQLADKSHDRPDFPVVRPDRAKARHCGHLDAVLDHPEQLGGFAFVGD